MTKTIAEIEQVIIGTAGHIDHGKTALVKALTGIDADTLPEEKRRGITIELGFVFMDNPGFDKQVVFIDVPGHEKLVKTMVAGASNIDAALLVIAADDGINAQTIEHFDILQLLRIETGIVALTKSDLVDGGRIREVTNQIRDFVAGTFMSNAPIMPVSSVTGAGVDEIKSAIFSIAQNVRRRHDSGTFRMPVDRVFTMPGFGAIIAGTVLSGRVRVADKIEVFPDGIMAKVRGIQVHNQDVQESCVGRRTAINLQDVKKDELRRGQCAAAPGSLSPTVRLDGRVCLLKSAGEELNNRTRLRLHIGTDEIICRIILLDREKLVPGETGFAQFVLESPTAALPKDRFIIRTFSPLQTIGGGQIVDSMPPKHKRFDAQLLDGLKKLEGDLKDVVEQTFVKAGFASQRSADVAVSVGVQQNEVANVVEDLCEAGKLVKIGTGATGRGAHAVAGQRYLHARAYADLSAKLVDFIKDYFAKHPYRLLMPLADLQSHFLSITDRHTLEATVDDLCKEGRLCRKDSKIGLVGYETRLAPHEQELADRTEQVFRGAGFAPPLEDDVRKEIGIPVETFTNLMTCLIERGRLIRLSEKVTYHAKYVQAAQQIVAEHLRMKQSITVGDLRDRLGVSRKYALALLEYFDSIGLTRREGDRHVMR